MEITAFICVLLQILFWGNLLQNKFKLMSREEQHLSNTGTNLYLESTKLNWTFQIWENINCHFVIVIVSGPFSNVENNRQLDSFLAL